MILEMHQTYRDREGDMIKIIAELDTFDGRHSSGIFVGQLLNSNSVATYERDGETISGFSNLVAPVYAGEQLWTSLTAREQLTLADIAKELQNKKITAIKITRTLTGSTLVEAKNIIEDLQGGYHGGFTHVRKEIQY